MINIMFLCDWGESPENLLKRYSRQTPGGLGIWKNDIKGVSNHLEADYFIALDGISGNNFEIAKDKIIFIKREPDLISKFTEKGFSNTRLYSDGNCGITWWLNKTYDELKDMKYPNKNNSCSLITGYKYSNRKAFIDRVFKEELPVDLFGRGFSYKYPTYKGEINSDGNCKSSGMISYKYSIALENSSQENYFSEKICDAILMWSMPLYWGCPNINEFFPKNSYKTINVYDVNARDIILSIINKPLGLVEIESLRLARDLILDKYNIWEIIRMEILKKEDEKIL